MNVTLSIEEKTAREARRLAATMGKSLNQVIREYLEQFTALDDAERDMRELRKLSDPPQGDAQGWRFDREELHERA